MQDSNLSHSGSVFIRPGREVIENWFSLIISILCRTSQKKYAKFGRLGSHQEHINSFVFDTGIYPSADEKIVSIYVKVAKDS